MRSPRSTDDEPTKPIWRRRSVQTAVSVLVVYAVIACLIFWPTGPLDSTRLPEGVLGDPDEMTWFLAWTPWALTHGHTKLRVVSDSELMVKQIQGKYRVNSPDLKPLYEEARRRLARLENFQIFHALRHKNQVADRLANEAMDRGTGRQPKEPTPLPAKATPYPDRASAPPRPASFGGLQQTTPPSQMLRGFVRDGAVHLLGGTTLPDGIFVKIIPE